MIIGLYWSSTKGEIFAAKNICEFENKIKVLKIRILDDQAPSLNRFVHEMFQIILT